MDNEPLEKASPNVVERTCRIVLDVKVYINEITLEHVADYFTPSETGEGLSWDWAERQNRLLLALLNDEESLIEFLARITRDELHMLIKSVHNQYRSDDESLQRVYSKMNSADAIYFKTATDEGLLDDNIELLDKAFVINWREASVKVIRVLK